MSSDYEQIGLPPLVTGTTKVVGVMGHPVKHSLSPPMHNAAFRALGLDFCYVPFDVPREKVADALRGLLALGAVGTNVTIPLKQAAFEAMDRVSEHAAALGVVNTVVCAGEELVGDNTDGPGFLRSLDEEGVDPAGRDIVILGAGGAAKAIAHALAERRPARLTIAARRPEQVEETVAGVARRFPDVPVEGADLLDPRQMNALCLKAEMVVNATPLGMYPEDQAMPPVPEEALHPGQVVCDIVYRPLETLLMRRARARGCQVVGGAGMLVHQGAIAFEQWTGVAAPVEVMRRALLAQLRQ